MKLAKTAEDISERQTHYASFSTTCLNRGLPVSVLLLNRTDDVKLQFNLQSVAFDFAGSLVSRSHP